ncbi:hypothetical protein ACFFVB_18555 [Formosa undariae]|uniref:Uncharacterized protein n=1 Tax=Formosa undariae TaxID=1325436 RepID=A0ABV5F6K1_9FLAO
MAYNINISPTRGFSLSGSNAPLANGWEFNPSPTLEITYELGAVTPVPVDIETRIKNYVTSLPSNTYDEIGIAILAYSENFNLNWFTVSGEITAATPRYVITKFNLEVTTTVTLQNLSLLLEGDYNGNMIFGVTARNKNTGLRENIDQVNYGLILHVVNPRSITTSPESLSYVYVRNGDLPISKTLSVSSPYGWTLVTSPLLAITGTGISDTSTPGETIISAPGNVDLNITFKSGLATVPQSTFLTEIAFQNTEGFSTIVQVLVTIFESETFIFNPPSLSFFAVIGLREATPLDFSVFGFGAYTLTTPSWLTLSGTSGTDTGTFTVTPLITENLTEGKYEGNIVLTAADDTEYFLPVVYEIAGTVYTLLDDGNYNFTKEVEYFRVYNLLRTGYDEALNYVQLQLVFTVYNYVTFLTKELTYDYTLPYFNNETQIHIGEIVERLMDKPATLADFGMLNNFDTIYPVLPVYKPASVKAIVNIINKTAKASVYNKTIHDMKFVAGIKPDAFTANKCILTKPEGIKRVTPNSREIVNFLVDKGYYTVKLQKNNDDAVIVAANSTGTQNIFRYYFNFSAYLPGDVVRVQVVSDGNTFTKVYAVVPEEKYSNHIAFVNSFKVLELLECTGSIVLTSDIQKENVSYYRDLNRVIENVDSESEVVLTVNTGVVFRKNQTIIDAILDGKKAWLLRDDGNHIELVPRPTKITNYDSDQELYAYTIQFDVNLKKDGEIYLF